MTNTYLTGNSIGSTNPKDLYDNASNFDEFSLSPLPSFDDRLGVRRDTMTGMQYEFDSAQAGRAQEFELLLSRLGYEDVGVYAAGLVLTRRNQVFQRAGVYYRAGSTVVFPYTMTGDWATEGSKFVLLGDALIREDLADSSDPYAGASLVGSVERVFADYAALRAFPKDSSPLAFVTATASHWALDPSDTSSAENLDLGILVAADGGRWKIKTGTGISRAQAGKPGTAFNDWGYTWGYGSPGATMNGNGNKFNYFSLYIENDRAVQQVGLNGATGSKVDGLNVTMIFGGPTTRGGRHAIEGVLLQGFGSAGPTDQNNQDRFYVGVQGQTLSNTGDGGTGVGDVRGAYFGGSSYAGISGTADFVANVTGHEFNTDIQTGSGHRVAIHTGIQIASFIGERGYGIDSAVSISNLGGSTRGWKYGICLHGSNGAPALEADSTLIKVFPAASGSAAIDSVIDTVGVTCNTIINADGVNLRKGVLDLFAPGSVVSLGSPISATNQTIQFKSGGASAAYDSRIQAIGGTSAAGAGLLQLECANLLTSAALMRSTADNYSALGSMAYRFSQIVLATSPVVSSDLRGKVDVSPVSLGLEFVEHLVANDGAIQYRTLESGNTEEREVQVGTRTVEVQETEEYEQTTLEVEVVDGVATQRQVTRTLTRPVCDDVIVVDESGMTVMSEVKRPIGTISVKQEDGTEKEEIEYEIISEPMTVKVPRIKLVEEPVYEKLISPVVGKRTHLGLSAQGLKAALDAFGIEDCAAWCLADPADPESRQAVRYEQLIPVLFKAIAELSTKLNAK